MGHTKKILHVIECYGAGVGRAADAFTRLSGDKVENHLIYIGEENPERNEKYVSIRRFSDNPLMRFRQVREAVDDLKPDLIMAHSSWAGLYTRVQPLPAPIIYQPHCYKFEDPDEKKILRKIYRLVEKLLTLNTNATVVLTARERTLTNQLNKKIKTIWYPNISSLPNEVEPVKRKDSQVRVGMMGRLSGQKDPLWFLETKQKLGKNNNIEFVWIGGGDEEYENQLRTDGIRVTGWLDTDEVLNEISNLDIYFHTAKYEGFPISILDAVKLDIPVIARAIPAYDGAGLKLVSNPSEAAKAIVEIADSEQAKKEVIEAQEVLKKTMNEEQQKKGILQVLSLAGE